MKNSFIVYVLKIKISPIYRKPGKKIVLNFLLTINVEITVSDDSEIGGVSMNRKERAWQGSEASLSILTREPAVVELFKILKSNRLFRRASTILSFRFTFHGIPLPLPPSPFFREPKTVTLPFENFSSEFLWNFFLFSFFFSFLLREQGNLAKNRRGFFRWAGQWRYTGPCLSFLFFY